MDINKSIAVAFTGYPTSKIIYFKNDPNLLTAISKKVEIIIRRLYQCGYTTFLSGMEEGFDILASEAVFKLKQEFQEIKLIAVISFIGRELSLNHSDRLHSQTIYNSADEVVFTSDADNSKALLIRNQYLLANCSQIVCYYDGQRSDTMYIVNRAVKIGLPIINVYEELADYFINTSVIK